jgi:alanyl-tRNA synthetase
VSARLYYDDPYVVEFVADVLAVAECDGRYEVLLDRTAFYPTSGGQPCDLGTLGSAEVVDVVERDGRVVHVLRSLEGLERGQTVRGRVDYGRRLDHMQQHLGQHLLSAAFEKVLDAETVGFHLGAETVTIDLALPWLTEHQADQVEDLANQIVIENRRVSSAWCSPQEASKLPLRRFPDRQGTLRVVIVHDFDYSPCCGTHPQSTGEVGIVKILGWERSRSGTRVSFLCGHRALRDYRWKNAALSALARGLSVAPADVPAAVMRQGEHLHSLSRRIEKLQAAAIEHEAARLLAESRAESPGRFPVIVARWFGDRELDEIKELAATIAARGGAVALFAAVGDGGVRAVFARSDGVGEDMNVLMKVIMASLDGKGGGTPALAQGGVRAGGLDMAQRIVSLALESLSSRP